MAAISAEQFNLLRGMVAERCGITLGDDKAYLMESRLAGLLATTGAVDFQELCARVSRDAGGELAEAIVDAIATKETSWFRDGLPWQFLAESLVPGWLAQRAAGERGGVRIWSAACSTGQEPYSAAMVLEESCGTRAERDFEIVASDLSKEALRIAKAGVYNRIAMARGLDDARRGAYFTEDGAGWRIAERIRRRVRFEVVNLHGSFRALGRFDLVLLRNVAIYFSASARDRLFGQIADAMNPGGLLILGAAETLLGFETRFAAQEYGRMLYYRLR